ncbi:MAG: glycosyl transferase family 2 [Crocinitomicaceae bacterium]|jgi:glycosyltransferase involved in cell wall biosynthesis|nr:glycosyl transferase family 2 [Crocinitomicaceae bacterium]
MTEAPIISICSTTYNLEKYIARAIDSWLMQETAYSFEIVICDDASQDGTVKIIKEYQERFPGKIRLIEAEKNLGMLPNFIRSLNEAHGKYIAVCDGDDYWIDPLKLQKQVSFLEENTDFTACYTNSYVFNEETGEQSVAKKQLWDVAGPGELLLHDDFHKENVPLSPGHISGFVFRNILQNKYPQWFYEVDGVTDFPLYMILSKYGKAKFINEITSVYRNHPQSSSLVHYSFLRVQRNRIFMYKQVNAYLDYKYNRQIIQLIARHYLRIAKFHKKDKSAMKALTTFVRLFLYHPKFVLQRVSKNKVS